MSDAEKNALSELSNDPTIVIKPADKGGAIVVQDIDRYRNEVLRQLSDTRFYQKLKKDPIEEYQHDIFRFLQNGLKN